MGSKATTTFDTLFSGISLRFPRYALHELYKLPFVKMVHPDEYITVNDATSQGFHCNQNTVYVRNDQQERNLELIHVPSVHQLTDVIGVAINGKVYELL